jgi:hypothetical protein
MLRVSIMPAMRIALYAIDGFTCSYTLRGKNWHIFKLLELMDK